jgi:acetylornithine/N-succinyldiaminopimelate aminotransferase
VFLCNSGTEANEAALKLVRRHAPTRTKIVAAENSFHGRSLGALSVTGKASIREPFAPFGWHTVFVPYGDAEALRAAVDGDTAAVFLEPTLGEGGVVPPPAGYLAAAREICDATGTVFVLDEIQSAIGRTGAWFAHEHESVRPDVLTLAKGLGGGLPIGACIGLGRFGGTFSRGDHGSTFGGNPVACAAALAVLNVISSDGLLDHVVKVGGQLAEGIAAVSHPLLAKVEGRGLWLALGLTAEVSANVEAAAREAGFLVNAVQPGRIRLAPPLILSADQVAEFVDALPGILDRAQLDAAASTA